MILFEKYYHLNESVKSRKKQAVRQKIERVVQDLDWQIMSKTDTFDFKSALCYCNNICTTHEVKDFNEFEKRQLIKQVERQYLFYVELFNKSSGWGPEVSKPVLNNSKNVVVAVQTILSITDHDATDLLDI